MLKNMLVTGFLIGVLLLAPPAFAVSYSSSGLLDLSTLSFSGNVEVSGHVSPTKLDKVQSEENRTQGDKLREKPQIGHRMEGALLEGEDLHGTMLAGVRFKKAKLKSANLRNAMLAGADLRQANLEHADLQGAMLLGANLSGANLVNANFEEAMLVGAQLEGARIDGANFKNAFVSQDQVDDACGKPSALPLGIRLPKPC